MANQSPSPRPFLSSSHIFSAWPIHALFSTFPPPFVSPSFHSVLTNHNPRLPSGPPSPPRVSASPASPFSTSRLSIREVSGCPLLSPLSRPRDSHSFPSLCWQPSSFAFVFCPASLFPCTLCPVSLCPSGAFSFFHLAPASSLLSTSAGAPVLNVDAAGQPLTFRSALAGPFRSQ